MKLYPEWWTEAETRLAANEFKRLDSPQGNAWQGSLEVADGDGKNRAVTIRVNLPELFPFVKPSVFAIDPTINYSRHKLPGEGSLCLWSDKKDGWDPGCTIDQVLDRVRLWYRCHFSGEWNDSYEPLDLHLYFSGEHPLVVLPDRWVPPVDRLSGTFSVWQKENEKHIFVDNIGGDQFVRTSEDVVGKKLLFVQGEADYRGIWLRLREEPVPLSNLGPMIEELSRTTDQPVNQVLRILEGTLGGKIRPNRQHTLFLGLVYPGRDKNAHWLFLGADLPQGQNRWARLDNLKMCRLMSYSVTDGGSTALIRRTQHTAVGLKDKRVAVFGLGAIGGSIALLLAKAGVGHLNLIDDDRLRPGNVIRHTASLYSVGLEKSAAVKFQILEHAPYCDVKVLGQPHSWDALCGTVNGCDLVVSATANPPFELLINEACLRRDIPVMYVAGYRRASVGKIQLVRIGKDACRLCIQHFEGNDPKYPVVPSGDEGEFVEVGCGDPTVEATAVDLEATATIAARVAIKHLRNDSLVENHWWVVNEPLEGPTIFAADVPTVIPQTWSSSPDCPLCRQLMVSMDQGDHK
ncbi:Sulfur carrier protein ThiS adenylyltransferase [Anaerolineae bacterium]|nr:Sulfur carrier protein ThiS adenylyltransferase [Anaerolineae bacterium]